MCSQCPTDTTAAHGYPTPALMRAECGQRWYWDGSEWRAVSRVKYVALETEMGLLLAEKEAKRFKVQEETIGIWDKKVAVPLPTEYVSIPEYVPIPRESVDAQKEWDAQKQWDALKNTDWWLAKNVKTGTWSDIQAKNYVPWAKDWPEGAPFDWKALPATNEYWFHWASPFDGYDGNPTRFVCVVPTVVLVNLTWVPPSGR